MAAAEVAVVVLDPEEEAPTTAEPTEAGQEATTSDSPAPAEQGMERAPSATGDGGAIVRRVEAEAEQPGRRISTSGKAHLSRMRTSASEEEMGRQSHSALLDIVMVNVLQEWEEALADCAREAECQARIESNRASVAEAKAAVVLARLEAVGVRIEELTSQLQQSESQVDLAFDEVRAATEKVAAAEEAAVVANHGQAGAVAHADEAKAHTEEAKSRAREAEAKAREAKVWAKTVEMNAKEAAVRAETAEAIAKEAEVWAGTAVADYKASADFVQEVIEASLEAYTKGFDLCKVKMSAAFNISGPELNEIQAGDSESEEVAAEVEKEEETEEKPRSDGT